MNKSFTWHKVMLFGIINKLFFSALVLWKIPNKILFSLFKNKKSCLKIKLNEIKLFTCSLINVVCSFYMIIIEYIK